MAGGEAALAALLELGERPTALITSTDLVAVGVLHAAYSRKCVVPDELSVVGYDDIPIAAHTVPALTTLRMPIPEVTGEGVRLAIQFARDASLEQEANRTVFEPTLTVRQSTAAPATSTPTATPRVSTPVA
jgi:DNA-binding LacI/PurR family transcriptional regulator